MYPANNLKLGDYRAQCDICGFDYHASELRDYDPLHMSDLLRGRADNPSVPWARPDNSDDTSAVTNGDEAVTLVTGVDPSVQIWDTALTQDRDVKIMQSSGLLSSTFQIYNEQESAFSLDVKYIVPGKISNSNSITAPEDFSAASWQAVGTGATVGTNVTDDPLGIQTADTLEDDNAGNLEGRLDTFLTTDTSWTSSLYILKDTITSRFPAITIRWQGDVTVTGTVVLNTVTGATVVTSDANYTISTAEAVLDGTYWRLRLSGTYTNTGLVRVYMQVYPAYAQTLTTTSDATALGTITAWGASMETGLSLNTGYSVAIRSMSLPAVSVIKSTGDTWVEESYTPYGL